MTIQWRIILFGWLLLLRLSPPKKRNLWMMIGQWRCRVCWYYRNIGWMQWAGQDHDSDRMVGSQSNPPARHTMPVLLPVLPPWSVPRRVGRNPIRQIDATDVTTEQFLAKNDTVIQWNSLLCHAITITEYGVLTERMKRASPLRWRVICSIWRHPSDRKPSLNANK